MKRRILALILCAAMIFSLSACATETDIKLEDVQTEGIKSGTYTATEKGFGGDVTVSVTVDKDGKMTNLDLVGTDETQDIGGKALEVLKGEVLANQTDKVDAIVGATMSSNAVLTALSKALKEAGVDTDSMKTPEKTGIDEEKETQVVIVGSGASGMTAALSAAEKGVKVIVVEQAESYGGTALMGAEGFFAIESSQQKESGDTTTVDDMYKWFMNYTHQNSYGPLTRAFLDISGSTVDWVGQYGNPVTLMENTQLAHENQVKTYHKFDDKKVGFKNWYDNMINMGVEVIFSTKVTELIEENGKVVGVIGIKKDGGKLTVKADAVILSTGGYAANAEMVEKYIGLAPGEYDLMTSGSTGEGIKMAMDMGSGTYGIDLGAYHGAMLPMGNSFTFGSIMMTPAPIWIDRTGSRFCNEDIVYDFALWGNAAYKAGGDYWAVIDSASLNKFATEGCSFTHSFMKTTLVDQALDKSVFPSVVRAPIDVAADPEIVANLEKACKDEEWAIKAETIEELSEKIGVPVERLRSTIEKYNESVAEGKDTLYGKDSQYLKYSIEEGPFYALNPKVLFEGSIGGITTNEKLEVLRVDWSTIPGLYATGNNVGMIYDGSYPVLEGVTLGFAVNSGRLAGNNAADMILNK